MKKGCHRGEFNRYMGTAIVCWMRELGIYRPDISAQDLHLAMEHSTRRNRYYTGMQNYTPSTSLLSCYGQQDYQRDGNAAQRLHNLFLERFPRHVVKCHGYAHAYSHTQQQCYLASAI